MIPDRMSEEAMGCCPLRAAPGSDSLRKVHCTVAPMPSRRLWSDQWCSHSLGSMVGYKPLYVARDKVIVEVGKPVQRPGHEDRQDRAAKPKIKILPDLVHPRDTGSEPEP